MVDGFFACPPLEKMFCLSLKTRVNHIPHIIKKLRTEQGGTIDLSNDPARNGLSEVNV